MISALDKTFENDEADQRKKVGARWLAQSCPQRSYLDADIIVLLHGVLHSHLFNQNI